MKTPLFRIFSGALSVCIALSFALLSTAGNTADTNDSAVSLPIGKWKVSFANGATETVEIKADGSATVSEAARKSKGKASINNGLIEILFDDNRAERWSLDSSKQRMTVQHWHPAAAMSDKQFPTIGTAARIDAKPAALEVHEWGTFTVLQGSNGQVIPWYQAPNKLVDLPPFVRQSITITGKSGTYQGGKDTVRMETPVLYFYPQEKMDVTVSATFPQGRITEVFPPLVSPGFGGPSIWHGSLLPPDSPERKKVPAATGPKGRHYAAAREVPEAWLFHNKRLPTAPEQPVEDKGLTVVPLPVPSAEQSPTAQLVSTAAPADDEAEKSVEPIDHFIFYRGAGNHSFYELNAAQGDGPDTFTITNYGKETVPKLFAVRVREGQTSWLALDQLKKVDYVEGKALNQQSLTFPAPMGQAAEVAEDLREAMIASLHAEGLTQDEAAAMVATWDNLWFTEPGTRILAILPQQFADQMVPLTITPKPSKIDRVFVARVEIITRETEAKLTSLLQGPAIGNSGEAEIAGDASKLDNLQLGRYAAGGMERAVQLLERQSRNRFAKLEQTLQEREKVEQADKLAAKTD